MVNIKKNGAIGAAFEGYLVDGKLQLFAIIDSFLFDSL